MATTYEDIATAALQLLGAKQPISVRSVRRVLGKGSPNVIHRHLRDWRAAQLVPGTSQTPVRMVAQMTEAAPRFWALALEEARAQVSVEMDQLQHACDQARLHVDEVQGLLDDSEEQRLQALAEQQRAIAALETLAGRFASLQEHSARDARIAEESQSGLRAQQAITMQLTTKAGELEAKADQARFRHQQEILTRDDALQALGRDLDQTQVHLDQSNAERTRSAADLAVARANLEQRDRLLAELTERSATERAHGNLQEQRLLAEAQASRAAATAAEAALVPLLKAVETNADHAVLIAGIREELETKLPGRFERMAEQIGTLDLAIRAAMAHRPPGADDAAPPHQAP